MKINCPNCSANMKYSPHEGKCFCEHCAQYIEIKSIPIESYKINYDEMVCSGCGARILVDETNVVTDCIYCGSHQVLTQKLEEGFNPDFILPFRSNKEDAKKYYKDFVSEYKEYFSDNIKTEISDAEIKGIYVPFYVYTWEAKIFEDRDSDSCVYSDKKVVRKDGGKKFNDDLMELLQAFDFESKDEFNPAYLLGFYAEIPDDEIATNSDIREEVKTVSKFFYNEPLYQKNLEKIEKNLKENETPRYSFELNEKKLMLLPVWFIEIEEKYNFVINGRSGIRACLINNLDKSKLIFDRTSDKIIKKEDTKIIKSKLSKVVSTSRNTLIFLVLAAMFLLIGYYVDNIYGAVDSAPIIACALIYTLFKVITMDKK